MDFIGEGKTSYHDYLIYKIAPDDAEAGDIVVIDGVDYVLVTSVEGLKYTLSDGKGVLIPWTTINDPIYSGQIVIPGPNNRISRPDLFNRYLTLLAIHNDGEQLPQEIQYELVPSIGITPTTEPLT